MSQETNNCIIIGTGELSMVLHKVFHASGAFSKCKSGRFKTKHGVIITTEIIKGTIFPGKAITLTKPHKKNVVDKISMIEINKQRVNFAGAGDKVGICLSESSLKKISPFLEKN